MSFNKGILCPLSSAAGGQRSFYLVFSTNTSITVLIKQLVDRHPLLLNLTTVSVLRAGIRFQGYIAMRIHFPFIGQEISQLNVSLTSYPLALGANQSRCFPLLLIPYLPTLTSQAYLGSTYLVDFFNSILIADIAVTNNQSQIDTNHNGSPVCRSSRDAASISSSASQLGRFGLGVTGSPSISIYCS